MVKVLVVEDDEFVSGLISDCLKLDHYDVEVVATGNEASDRLRLYNYDLILLDVNLPEQSGLQLCEKYRGAGGVTPIIMLTGQRSIDDKEAGLNAGADDYLTKPFNARELVARVRAVLRRPPQLAPTRLKVGELELDPVSHEVLLAGKKLDLKPKEFTLLEFFMRNPNQVFSNNDILNRVWVSESEASPQAVRTCMQRLRDKIDREGHPSIITTVYGVGYKLEI
ncbi:MAG: response regulator transcription factor [Candidatus Melainabacteria bacterium]|nr:response regulator transcription factor [Candidatus Melainabacteria bacterium]